MTIEELLIPRWIVITKYPNNNDFPVGKLIDFHPWENCNLYWEHTIEDCQGKRSFLEIFFEEHPKIFKKLEWWEDRRLEDMPNFLKQTGYVDSFNKPVPDFYVKVEHHFTFNHTEWRSGSFKSFESYDIPYGNKWSGLASYRYGEFEPITEQEYLANKNKQTQ